MSLVLMLLAGCGPELLPLPEGEPRDLAALVDPFIGTGGDGYGVGCAFPGAAAPHGLVKVSPDTAGASGAAPGFYHGGGYHYDDELVQGFSHLHGHGIGLTAYGLVSLMPTDGMSEAKVDESGYHLPFSHDEESASPGRYDVTLREGDLSIDVTLTATERTALHRYTWRGASEPVVLLDLEHVLTEGTALGGSLSIDAATGRVEGWMDNRGQMGPAFRVYFVVLPDQAPTGVGVWADGAPVDGATEGAGLDLGAYLRFDAETVALRVALSLVDLDGARANLEAEHSGFDVETDAAATAAAWSELLSVVEVWGGDDTEATILATSLYHAALMPTVQSDVDGRYLGFDGAIQVADGWRWHTDLSLWDTYRTAHPLYTLLWPDRHLEILRSLGAMAEQGGALPLWPLASGDAGAMLGAPAAVVVGEAWAKGLLDDEPELARVLYDAAAASAFGTSTATYGGRPDPATWDELGYYPSDEFGASVAWSQELGIADAALAGLAAHLGEADAAALLGERAGYWKNNWDPAVGFFHARLRDGSFDENFDESEWLDEYTEGNARQYLWLVPQDPEGLFEVLGGADVAVERLDQLLLEGSLVEDEIWPNEWYWHGNEVDLHAPWLFALAGRPDLTRQWVDHVARASYSAEADGLAGNDDGGTLSSWYVFASLGLFPLAGGDRYVLGAPRYDRIRIPFDGGRLDIGRLGEGDVGAVFLNGAAHEAPDLRHGDLPGGGELLFLGQDAAR